MGFYLCEWNLQWSQNRGYETVRIGHRWLQDLERAECSTLIDPAQGETGPTQNMAAGSLCFLIIYQLVIPRGLATGNHKFIT